MIKTNKIDNFVVLIVAGFGNPGYTPVTPVVL